MFHKVIFTFKIGSSLDVSIEEMVVTYLMYSEYLRLGIRR